MRLDYDLVRQILLEVEGSSEPVRASAFVSSLHGMDDVCRHVELMRDAGFLKAELFGSMSTASGFQDAEVRGLTLKGYEYLNAVRSEKVWSKVKSTIAKTVGSATFDTVLALAVKTGSGLMGL